MVSVVDRGAGRHPVAVRSRTCATIAANTVKLNDDVPMTYVVKRGDTLWDISAIYLQEPWRWTDLGTPIPRLRTPT